MRRLLLCLSFAALASAQTFVGTKQTALVATAEVITVQQPATAAKTVSFVSAYIDCSVACTVTLERNGTAATTTTLTPAQVNPSVATVATAAAFSASNVGTGTVIGTYQIGAGGALIFDLSDIKQTGTGTAKNFTLRTSSITGTVNINIKWREL